MKNFLIILAATTLLGQFNKAVAQVANAQGQAKDQAFIMFIRSSAVIAPAKAPPMNQVVIKSCCERIVKDAQRVFFVKDRNGKMKLQLKGVYIHGAAMFFSVELNNRSVVDYDVDSIRFMITDAGKNRRPDPIASAGPKRLEPVFMYDTTAMIPGRSRISSVFVLPRFTLPPGRQLRIDIHERVDVGVRGGGRHLQIQTTNWTLGRARLI